MKKYSFLILIFGLLALLLFQRNLVMPFVYKVIQSDLFLVESKDQGSQTPIATPLTGLAFSHCNSQIKNQLGADVSISFADKPLNAWSLGNYQFVINGEFDLTEANKSPINKKYVCRINYKNGDNEEGAADFANWSIEGISGLDPV